MEEYILDKQSIFVTKFNGDISSIEENIKSVRNLDREGMIVSNENGYHSNYIHYGFEELKAEVQKEASQLLGNSQLDCFWLNVNNGFSRNSIHVHMDKMSSKFFCFSCVYYHKVCCENSPIVFESLIPSLFPNKHKYIPKNQDMVFFWGSIPHSVEPCLQENHERISIAFNISQT